MALLFVFAPLAPATASVASGEYDIKAAFLFNFAKYVEWPIDAFASESAPIVFCVFGSNPFGSRFTALESRAIKSHDIESRVVKTVDELAPCHLLFVAVDYKDDAPALVAFARDHSMLLVTDDGIPGTIVFATIDQRLGFSVDRAMARSSKLTVSSHLLRLAREVRN